LHFAPRRVETAEEGTGDIVQRPLRLDPLAEGIARQEGSGSASSLPRIVGDLLRLLELVKRTPLPLGR
jgi:hypothetical protein